MTSLSHDTAATIHRNYKLSAVCRQLLAGKSLARALCNVALSQHAVSGRVLDIGSKNGDGSYYDYLGVDEVTEIVYTDLEESPGVVKLDVEAPFPLPSDTFDAVLAFNLFEHVYNYRMAPKEIFRVLRCGGIVLVAMPFMYEFHGDYDDFYRFTDSALLRIWEEAGFECVHMEALGAGILAPALTKFASLAIPTRARHIASALLYLATVPADRLLARVRPPIDGKTIPARFALAHFAVFRRPSTSA